MLATFSAILCVALVCVTPILSGVKTVEGVEPPFAQGGKIKIHAERKALGLH